MQKPQRGALVEVAYVGECSVGALYEYNEGRNICGQAFLASIPEYRGCSLGEARDQVGEGVLAWFRKAGFPCVKDGDCMDSNTTPSFQALYIVTAYSDTSSDRPDCLLRIRAEEDGIPWVEVEEAREWLDRHREIVRGRLRELSEDVVALIDHTNTRISSGMPSPGPVSAIIRHPDMCGWGSRSEELGPTEAQFVRDTVLRYITTPGVGDEFRVVPIR